MKTLYSFIFLLLGGATCIAGPVQKTYVLEYDSPAPNKGKDYTKIVARGFPYDEDWERWSLAIGNGYMGANVFGRTDTERIQLSEKTLGNASCYKNGGFTNFAEMYIDFNHEGVKDYKRTLCLNNAVSTVEYQYNGVNYYREYLANYPSNVIAIKLTADQGNQLSFTFRGEIPYLKTERTDDQRTGQVTTDGNTMTLSGNMEYYDVDYEAQVRVVNYGGNCKIKNQNQIQVNEADSAVIYITAGTSYVLNEGVFCLPPLEKCKGKVNVHPHKAVSKRIRYAVKQGYENIKKEHVTDYQNLFNRVNLSLTDDIPEIPTDQLIHEYQKGKHHTYLEELFFQYGRYMLIASSRPGSLPPNLQGAWTQYDYSPWSGGYWHNVNIQMNYWPAFNTNLAELFEPFVAYNEAYRQAARIKASEYIKQHNPEAYSEDPNKNGWTIGCGASAYGISAPGGHSGPGTGGFTTKLYWDYYDFTRNEKILKDHTYPALRGMAEFLSKLLKEDGKGHLLADPSFSPEQYHKGKHYQSKGCTFDQGMIWENFNDLLNAARILNIKDSFLTEIEGKINKLDPIQIGEDGQIKEYREERKYSEFGDPHHRHISQLCPLYPGTLINNNTPEWLKAAKVSIDMRGKEAGYFAGWPMAHRMNACARVKNGNDAYHYYKILLCKGIYENLWGKCPPFQVDSSLGGTAGVAEMLLQSHEGYIYPLPALPAKWANGSFKGLVARGNFEVSLKWEKHTVKAMNIVSNKGGICKVFLPSSSLKIHDMKNKEIPFQQTAPNVIQFNTKKGMQYNFSL